MDTKSDQEQQATWLVWIFGAVFALFIVGPIVAIATMAPRGGAFDLEQASPLDAPVGQTGPVNDADFAFGYLEFDWNPKAPGGVPGFNSWPPASRRE